jgi:hypothetical protein
MAGFNFKIHDMITLSPNVKYVFYGGEYAPDGDFYLNLTAFFEFKSKIGGDDKLELPLRSESLPFRPRVFGD